MIFVNGVSVAISDDGTTWLIMMAQEPGANEPVEVARLLMSETTALMIAQAIQNTSQEARQKRSLSS